MMYLEKPPRLIETRMFSSMPAEFRRPGVSSEWAEANRRGMPDFQRAESERPSAQSGRDRVVRCNDARQQRLARAADASLRAF